jgi:hypothetical protein
VGVEEGEHSIEPPGGQPLIMPEASRHTVEHFTGCDGPVCR